jgi:hypothetical protein
MLPRGVRIDLRLGLRIPISRDSVSAVGGSKDRKGASERLQLEEEAWKRALVEYGGSTSITSDSSIFTWSADSTRIGVLLSAVIILG